MVADTNRMPAAPRVFARLIATLIAAGFLAAVILPASAEARDANCGSLRFKGVKFLVKASTWGHASNSRPSCKQARSVTKRFLKDKDVAPWVCNPEMGRVVAYCMKGASGGVSVKILYGYRPDDPNAPRP